MYMIVVTANVGLLPSEILKTHITESGRSFKSAGAQLSLRRLDHHGQSSG